MSTTPQKLLDALQEFWPEFQKGTVAEDYLWTIACESLGLQVSPPQELWGEAFVACYKPKPEMFDLASTSSV